MRVALFGTITAIAALLSVPAILYVWQRPSLTNTLSLLVTFGVFFTVYTWVRSVLAQVVIGIVVLILNLIEIVHLLAYHSLVTTAAMEGIIYVDPNEAREFVASHVPAFGFGVLIMVVFCGLAIAKARLDDLGRRPRFVIGAVTLIAPFLLLVSRVSTQGTAEDVYLPTSVLDQLTGFLGMNPLTHTVSGLVSTVGEQVALERERRSYEGFDFEAFRARVPAPRELYVIVIGESARRRNWSLYGYRRSTDPYLARTPNLVAFPHAISPATVTSRSVPLSLTVALGDEAGAARSPKSLVTAFREVGFKTFWLTNQGTSREALGGKLALIMGEADVVRTASANFWRSALDQALLPELDSALADPAPRKLIVIHTMGSHTNYPERLPPAWASRTFEVPLGVAHTFRDNPDLEQEAPTIDAYDRTILYTDWMLHEIIERCRRTGEYGALVYFSDHGERLYDDDKEQISHGFEDFEKYDVQIPLLLWTSDAFDRANPERVKAITADAAEPVSSGDVGSALLDLADIRFQGLSLSRSFFGADFVPRPRRIVSTTGKVIAYVGGSGAPAVLAPTN